MLSPTSIPPARRPDLILVPSGKDGRRVLKHPRTGEFYALGEQETFLLERLDGQRTTDQVCRAFEEAFGEPLTPEDLKEFAGLAASRGLLQRPDRDEGQPPCEGADSTPAASPSSRLFGASSYRQSVLFWRKRLFDPDRFCRWLEPKLRFFWTPAFLIISALCIVAAGWLALLNAGQLISYFPHSLRWETLPAVWLTLALVTVGHEFAHGLTCKRYGGEVREMGFLLIFLMPAFYCNVSDAWLFPEKRKRLWVTAAGGYFELFLWALAVFTWRLTLQDSLVNYLAWVVLSVTGLRMLFNFNPLIKLDGYYLLSDALEVPNLRQRSWDSLADHVRWLLWGARRPEAGPRRRLLLSFGAASWLFSIVLLGVILTFVSRLLHGVLGPAGLLGGPCLAAVVMPRMFRGFSNGEVRRMVHSRWKRTFVWCLVLIGGPLALFLIPMRDRVGGRFELRAVQRAELRAPVAGFLKRVSADEGDHVSAGSVVAELHIPDLASRIAEKQAKIREAEAQLRLLERGTRPEKLRAQRRRIARLRRARDLAREKLTRRKEGLAQELVRLEQKIEQYAAELDSARDALHRAEELLARSAISEQEYEEKEIAFRVARSRWEQARAEKAAREAEGTLDAEAELLRRNNELADAESRLALLKAGSRPQEIEAAEARLRRLKEELDSLMSQRDRLQVSCPVSGTIMTPRLRDKVGRYFEEGALICEVADPRPLQAEVLLDEDDAGRVGTEQPVSLKARALPFETFSGQVDRIAPRAEAGEIQSTVSVHCRLRDHEASLRPGMTGYARIYCGRCSVGEFLIDRALRFLRTEFWW